MSEFQFDADKKFQQNADNFLESVKDIDPEMAALLEDNWAKLLQIVRDGERNINSRSEFNEAISAALDNLLAIQALKEDQ